MILLFNNLIYIFYLYLRDEFLFGKLFNKKNEKSSGELKDKIEEDVII